MEIKQEFQRGVAIITCKDLCDWLNHENNVEKKRLQYLALEEFLILRRKVASKQGQFHSDRYNRMYWASSF